MPTIPMNQVSEMSQARGNSGQAWPRRLRVLAVVALALTIAVPAIAAVEGWEIDAARLIGSLSGG